MSPREVVVVGGSTAGATVLRELRARGYEGRLTLVDPEPGTNRPPLSKAVLADAGAEASVLMDHASLEVEHVLAPASGLDHPARTLLTADGGAHRFDALVIATGSRARRIAAPGQEGEVVLRSVQDARALRGRFAEASSAVVVGAGFLGLEVATAAAKAGLRVTVVDVDPPLERLLGEHLASAVGERARALGIGFRRSGAALVGHPVRGVRLDGGEELAADVVVSCVGDEPVTEWLGDASPELEHGVVIDDHARTSLAGVYAAGDVAAVRTGWRCPASAVLGQRGHAGAGRGRLGPGAARRRPDRGPLLLDRDRGHGDQGRGAAAARGPPAGAGGRRLGPRAPGVGHVHRGSLRHPPFPAEVAGDTARAVGPPALHRARRRCHVTSRLARGVAARDDADSWVVGLRPAGRRAESAIDPGPRLESALRVLGPGPVEWGLELATAMTEAMLAAVPELAVPDVEVELHRGSVAVVLGSLLELHTSGGLANLEVPEILLGPAELVGRGIGIEHMLRSIHTAHAVGMRAMMDECARLVPPELRFEESRRVADVLLELTGSLLDVMTQEFAEAHVAWSATSSAVRRELVQEILDPAGPGVTAGDVRSVLGYDLEAHHLAVVLWADVSSEVSAPVLESSARALVRRAGATGTLVVPVGRRQVWAWGSRTVDGVFEVTPADVPDGVRCALGVVGRGRDGFRTGHRQAMEVVGVAEHSVRDARLFRYADLELVCIAARDLPSARAMVQRELGALGALDDATTELRETLTCYLAVERSLNRSAEALHVARSTVAYRVRRAEELRGAPIEERRPQLQVALMLAEELGPQVLG